MPKTAPKQVPMASAVMASLILGSWPFSSSMLALDAVPISVPTVSNTSTNQKENMVMNPRLRAPLKSIFMKMGVSESGFPMMLPVW